MESDDNKLEKALIEFKKEILITDFAQALEMLRHYDKVNWDLTKFSFSQIMLTVAACWAIIGYADASKAGFLYSKTNLCIGVLLFLSSFFVFLTMYAIMKNRSYFVLMSHYINEHRDNAIKGNPFNFENKSNMWHNPDFPQYFDKGSTQMICYYLLAVCFLIMFSVGVFLLTTFIPISALPYVCAVAAFLFGIVICFFMPSFPIR